MYKKIVLSIFILKICTASEFIVEKKSKCPAKEVSDLVLEESAKYLRHSNDLNKVSVELETQILDILDNGISNNFKGVETSNLVKLLDEIKKINYNYKKIRDDLSKSVEMVNKLSNQKTNPKGKK